MKTEFLSINDIFFLVKIGFKYVLALFNGFYLIRMVSHPNEYNIITNKMIFIGIGILLKIILIIIYWIYFMDIYILKKNCNKKIFGNIYCNSNKIIDNNISTTIIESDDFEYKKLIKKFFFKKMYYSLKKSHKIVELYMLKIYNSDFNCYFCNIRDILYAIIWYISLYYWRRDEYNILWSFNKIPIYIYNILLILLSSSYIDLVMIIISYNKSKYHMMKSKLLIDVFFSSPSAFFFSRHFFVLENGIDIYFLMGFLRIIKVFLNVSYAKTEQSYILTNTEIKVIRIILGVLLLCNAFASTLYTIQGIHPYNIDNHDLYYILNNYLDYFYFSIISISTVGYGDIIPTNKLSRVVCIFFIFWTFIWVPIQFNDLIISIFCKKETHGKLSMNNQKLILLIGDIQPEQLNTFFFESVAYGNKLKFHILTTYPINLYEEQIKIADNYCISIYIKNFDLNEKHNTNLLYSVNAQNAYYMFLFSNKFNNGHYNIDTKSFTRLLILAKFLHGEKKNAVIELRNKCVSNIVKSIGCEHFPIVNLKYSLIVKNLVCPGFITFLSNLFTAYDYNENPYYFNNSKYLHSFNFIAEFNKGSIAKIFSFAVHDNMIGLNFDKLFYKLYESLGILLIGIESSHMNNNHFVYSNKKRFNFFFENMDRSMIKGNRIRERTRRTGQIGGHKKLKFKLVYLCFLKRYLNSLSRNNCNNAKMVTILNGKKNNSKMNKPNKKIYLKEIPNLLEMLNNHVQHTKKSNLSTPMCNNGIKESYKEKNKKSYHYIIDTNNINVAYKNNIPEKGKKDRGGIYIDNKNTNDICIRTNESYKNNKLRNRRPKNGKPYLGILKNCNDELIHTKKMNNYYESYSNNSNINEICIPNKRNGKPKCYLNLLGKNYLMKENDKCIVLANSKKVINYLSKAKNLFWLFEINSTKIDKVTYDLKSIIKTKQCFNKIPTSNLVKNIPIMPNMKNKSIINKHDSKIMPMDYYDLFNAYKSFRVFPQKNYGITKNMLRVSYKENFNNGINNNRSISDRISDDRSNSSSLSKISMDKNTLSLTKISNENSHIYPNSNNNYTVNYEHSDQSFFKGCVNWGGCNNGNTSIRENAQNEVDVMNSVIKMEADKYTFEVNLNDTILVENDYNVLQKNNINNFASIKKSNSNSNNNNKCEQIKQLNNNLTFIKNEKKTKSNKKNTNDILERGKNGVAYSYLDAYQKYFVHSPKNKKLLLLINYTSNIIQLVKLINKTCKYNIIILTSEISSINIHHIYNVVFIKCKTMDDYSLLNAGLLQAEYILILPTEVNDINEINEIDMNNIILTRKITYLLKKKKKNYFINNIITELINPTNIIFLEENNMIKMTEKKSSYSDFFPYINSTQFYSSNIISETMLYNFMAHHKSFTKFPVSNNTLKCLIKDINIIYVCELRKYSDFSFKKIKTFRDLFLFLSKKCIIAIALYRKGDKHVPFYIYTKPCENCLIRFDDIVYVL
ncbi:potassium channel K2, putative [Plasmodium yoelii]|uniref:Potassium channel K2 n=2 Tax=Plasmodium yoelii TaxID=5861 RepID=A0AAE9WU36_PLAYO|nr:potassium channel K2, putative [Plasmodium yoelii]WBY60025.1 potassium channel K2 [Plasmodium yoelii yoelii]CDU19956.1 potassium channel, putative [Plasmodium yoelii]VTZ80714.1 potassium channel K2, putative [Plasmodium yoelii]|eukprot:XP_729854.2 potassium channel K2, putative [Plasmodium yoelii]